MVYFHVSQKTREILLRAFSVRAAEHRVDLYLSAQTTTQTETNLLTHMFALCLRIDDFATDTAVLATDLSMPVLRYVLSALPCVTSSDPLIV